VVGRTRVLVVSAVSGAVTLAAALFPQSDVAYRLPDLRVAFATAALLVTLLAGLILVGRFLRHARLTELTLAYSLGVLALSEVIFMIVPALDQDWRPLPAWAALGTGSLGAGLFALAAFVPRRRLPRPGVVLAAGAAVVTVALIVITVLAVSFTAGLPTEPTGVTARDALAGAGPGADAVLLALEASVVAAYGLAAFGFLRRSRRLHDEFFGWLAIAAVLAAAADINYLLYPSAYSQLVSLADVFRLCFYVVLLTGSVREIWLYWRAMSEVSVQEERRRIACDLHDGLAQELAYLLRSLRALDGTVDAEMKASLRRAAERAQLETRVAISALTARPRQSVDVAIGQAVSEVAARDRIKLELDVIPGIRLPTARAEALTRIACEAVSNAARHSGAAHVSLSLRRRGSRVWLCVSDNGSGFDLAAPSDSFGLTSMRERASSVGGDLRISSEPGRGTEVEATL
jgi:signal transduction histidine kinase